MKAIVMPRSISTDRMRAGRLTSAGAAGASNVVAIVEDITLPSSTESASSASNAFHYPLSLLTSLPSGTFGATAVSNPTTAFLA
jgi:hypothetical protein